MSIFASKEKMLHRLKICSMCPLIIKGILNRCSACGCPIKSKVTLVKSSCPKGKWK